MNQRKKSSSSMPAVLLPSVARTEPERTEPERTEPERREPERREPERSESDRSATEGNTVSPPEPRPNSEVVAQAIRRRYTAEYKESILAEADQARGSGGIGA